MFDLLEGSARFRGYETRTRDEVAGMESVLSALTPYPFTNETPVAVLDGVRDLIKRRRGQGHAYSVVADALMTSTTLSEAITACEQTLNTEGWAERDPVGQLEWEIQGLRAYNK